MDRTLLAGTSGFAIRSEMCNWRCLPDEGHPSRVRFFLMRLEFLGILPPVPSVVHHPEDLNNPWTYLVMVSPLKDGSVEMFS